MNRTNARPLVCFEDADDFPRGGGREFRRARIGHLARQVQNRLARVVELRRQLQEPRGADALQPQAAADVVERSLHRQRGRGQHRGLHAVEQQFADDGGDVDRRGAKKHPAASRFEEVDVFRIARPQDEAQVVAQLAGPPREAQRILRRRIAGLAIGIGLAA